MSPDDLEMEPVRGLPHALPPGESIVWQGQPAWRPLARRALKIRWLAAYFAVFLVARAGIALARDEGLDGAIVVGTMVGLFALCLGLVALFAWLTARATVYTITTERVVMQIGVALSLHWNLPFRRLAAADLDVRDGGEGDIILRLAPPDRVRWVHFWPNVEPGRVFRARPAMRSVPDAARAAALLKEAVARWAARQDSGTVVSRDDDAAASAPRTERTRTSRPPLGAELFPEPSH